ncbi:MAG: phosphopantetheine-binding protein [Hoeflea sp.]|uniref:acyl carrier protein n=1 Tax=Hoeflea sp. TaxID=1940281 RepID=UPI001DF38A21|nr:phosphopantetheine-binding protein [Hoeflea sp.]MBU4530971.1 phosphopantetheine-binding protein [Alphaproteobacteria bacterium]MBU4542746.1 phosphopantetheine-binding protein [Alphaproteobacteria bacterium]MBU4552558.1 phosphopantetheine-binding protein [Alphaproteobacteria bacterium]MBV1722863.1 phosphopantetheine-binding protein [Hoeflea sp.]MBV1762774.1 phosphopantetheine-binding protein [Hoeflea sp.]
MSDADGDLVEIESQLLDIVAQEGMIDRGRLNKDAVLLDLDIQSADYVMILMAIEEKWGVYLPVDEDLTEAKTVGDLVELVKGKIVEHKAKKATA